MKLLIKLAARGLVALVVLCVASAGLVGLSIPFAAMQRFDPGIDAPLLKRVVIERIDVLPMTDETPEILEDRWVVIENGVVSGILNENPAPVADELRIDGAGRTLTPGLIDMHVHVFDRTDLLLYLSHGVTTVRNMMGLEGIHLEWRAELEAGRYPGPTLYTASPTLNQNDSAPFHKYVTSEEEARALVRRYAGAGYDFIKIYNGLEAHIFHAIMDEAAALNIPVTGHLPQAVEFDDILASGMHSIEHAEEIYAYPLNRLREGHPSIEAIASNVKASGVYVTPTLTAFHNLSKAAKDKDAFMATIPRDYINPVIAFFGDRMMADPLSREDPIRYIRAAENMGRVTRALYEAGMPLLLGSDTGPSLTVSGAATHDEILRLSEFGLSPYDILYSGTARAAQALGRNNDLGMISVGAKADLLIVEGDPLSDLATLREPVFVIKGGAVYDQAALAQMKRRARRNMSVYETVGRLLRHELIK
ncbi:MAG: amidohydrolase family protein [Pseudomonadota bacterium]